MAKVKNEIKNLLLIIADKFSRIPDKGIGLHCKLQSAIIVSKTMEDIIFNMEKNPYPLILSTLESVCDYLDNIFVVLEECDWSNIHESSETGKINARNTTELFEDAWTTYSDNTYQHSIELVKRRLIMSGIDNAFLKGKLCFDGGCGTGRLSIALSQLGALKVIAMDMGGRSLDFLENKIKQYNVSNIEIVKGDVTDLNNFPDEIFDFVASYGVLHHTNNMWQGLKEHYRVLKKGGNLWLYLYGEGGIYWEVYDQLREFVPDILIKYMLSDYGFRDGFIYTFHDNVFAPRVYTKTTDVISYLNSISSLNFKFAKGFAAYDDTQKLIETKYGKDIYGPEGEVRILINKK